MIIAQITDTHIMPKGQAWLNKPETEVAERLKQVVEHLNRLVPRPDAVLLTGDTIDSGGKAAYQYLKEIITSLSIPLYIIPGNHDNREEMREAFGDRAYMPREGFIQYVIEDYPVRLIALDTNIPNEDYGLLCKERLHWLEQRLKENTTKPTLLFMHHFPMKVGQKCFDNLICQTQGDFEGLIRSSPNVIGIVAGHYHKLLSTNFGDKMFFVAPSVAPTHYFATNNDNHVTAIELVHPSFTLHRWMGKSKMLSEAVQAIPSDKYIPWKS